MSYRVSHITGPIAWAAVVYYLQSNSTVTSVKGIVYTVRYDNDTVFITGTERNLGEEPIHKHDFINTFNNFSALPVLNTNTAKSLFAPAIYKKRSPFFALLIASGIITPL